MAAPTLNALAGLRQMEAEEDEDEEENVDNSSENVSGDKYKTETKENTSEEMNTIGKDQEIPVEPKPLKSILKKRKPAENPAGVEKDASIEEESSIEKPKFGGSISLALKMIKESKQQKPVVPEEKKEDDTEPKPSAFILEMEKQKDQLLNSFHYQLPPNGVDVDDMEWEGSSSPQEQDRGPYSFFLQEQKRLKEKKSKKKKAVVSKPFSLPVSKPPQKADPVTKAIQEMVAVPAPKEENADFVVLITNLPYKVTKHELVVILGIWPKGGYDGLRLITNSSGSPAGHAYCILSRHADMMQLLRLSGLQMQGRKIKVTMSNQKNLIDDWKCTKKAVALLRKSRVVRIGNLPFNLEKSKLIEAIPDVKLSKSDIYWKPLKEGQENSGRGYLVLQSSEDAKKIANKEYHVQKRKLELDQVHPSDMEKFCNQCNINIDKDVTLTDPCDEADFDNIDDLNLSQTEASVITKEVEKKPPVDSNFVVMEDLENVTIPRIESKSQRIEKKNSELQRKRAERKHSDAIPHGCPRRRSPERGGQNFAMPPFKPTPYVRMYDVPDKATTSDIRIFFEPILPAKIAQNIGYDIFDIEFYNPDDAWEAMKKHMLLMRKNVIKLEMLPGPPRPLPPRPVPRDNKRPDPIIHPGFDPRMMHPPRPELGPPGVSPEQIHSMGPVPGPMAFPDMGPSFMHPLAPMPMHPDMLPRGMSSRATGLDGPRIPMPLPHMHLERMPLGPRPMMFMPPAQPYMMPGSGPMPMDPNFHGPVIPQQVTVIDPSQMPPPMHGDKPENMTQSSRDKTGSAEQEEKPEPQKELIPVPPLPEDFTTYEVPPYSKDTPVGQCTITPMQGYFCQLCNKFYSSRSSAKVSHCKSRGHYDRMKQFMQEKKRLKKLAEAETKSK